MYRQRRAKNENFHLFPHLPPVRGLRMPGAKAKACRVDKTVADPGAEVRLEKACAWLRQTIKPNFADVAREFDVKYHTLRRRYYYLNGPAEDAQGRRRMLSRRQEAVLVIWMKLWGAQGQPVTNGSLHTKVAKLTGRTPSRRWLTKFKGRHKDLVYRRPSQLDLKRARCFNPTVVAKHFRELALLLESHGPFKPCNIYNMDEKGAQMGGGRKSSGMKFFFDKATRDRYRKRSADLELVTIVECVSADGVGLTPGFIFSGSTYEMSWFEECADREHLWYVQCHHCRFINNSDKYCSVLAASVSLRKVEQTMNNA